MRPQHKKNTKTSYTHNLQYLEDHFRLFDLLTAQKKAYASCGDGNEDANALSKQIRRQLATIRRRHNSTRQRQTFCLERIVKQYRLCRVERDILLFLLYRYFSLHSPSTTGRVILENIADSRHSLMRYYVYFLQDGRLRANHLVVCHSDDEHDGDHNLLDMEFSVPETVVCQVLGEKSGADDLPDEKSCAGDLPGEKSCDSDLPAEQEKTYSAYLRLYFRQIFLLEVRVVQSLLRHRRLNESWHDAEDDEDEPRIILEPVLLQQNLAEVREQIAAFVPVSADYPLEQLAREYNLSEPEKLIIVGLLRSSFGLPSMCVNYGGSYDGQKLLALIADSFNDMIAYRRLFYQSGKLRSNGLIQIEKDWSGQNVLEAEFFLAEGVVRRLMAHDGAEEEENEESNDGDSGCGCGGDRRRKMPTANLLLSMEPRFSFADVVLPEAQKKSIEIALSQQLHHEIIFNTWGFAKNFPYGSALTMLFSGPPGTGKTMMAEAIAHTLQQKLLIANYSQIQNLYVGETEKRIVAAFKKAQQENGVLLWDEADAMFYSRNMAQSSWECRDVNIILQELERFHGVVILTTNRKVALDHALERRISLKVEFGMPDSEQREQIWKRLIPREAPLAADVDCHMLAEKYAVSGGIIKNAILHAARHAAYRGSAQITMSDFVSAIEMELEGGWNKAHGPIGFVK
jgi:AAA+ superfamily predicted ATPase